MEKMIFCTLFDSNYLSRGLVTYRSLEQVCPSFHLYVFAFDDLSAKVLNDLNLDKITVITLKEFEDPELLKIKPTRNIGEYCWTCTPSTIRYILKTYNTPHCTYIDADLEFYQNPSVLIEEMGEKSVLITSHRYTPKYDKSLISGKYCVQFMTFRNDEKGLQVLNWWRDACLDWCYDRAEDGKFGDQKYLDTWPSQFDSVHELENLGGGVAPWNVQQYDVSNSSNGLEGIEINTGNKFEFVFYHFHQLKMLPNDQVDYCRYQLSDKVKNLIYQPYARNLAKVMTDLEVRFPEMRGKGITVKKNDWKAPLVWLKRKLRGDYNIFGLRDIK